MKGKKSKLLFCADIGTSSLKGAIVNPKGEAVEFGRVQIIEEKRHFQNWDPWVWMYKLRTLIHKFKNIDKIEGIVISGNGPTVVPVSRDAIPVDEALLWLDNRNIHVEGTSSYYLPKVKWLQSENPRIYEKADFFLGCPEFLCMFMTGNAAMVSSVEPFDKYIWEKGDIDKYGLEAEKLPPIIRTGGIIGSVVPSAANFFDLAVGLPVFAGGSDFHMSLLGTNSIHHGDTCDRAGTSEGINFCSIDEIYSENLRTLPHAVPGFFNIAGILSSTGRLFDWFRDFSGQQKVSYDVMLERIQELALERRQHPRELPWFFPTIHEGASWEFSKGMFIGLGADHGKEEMGTAVVESIGFAVKESISILEKNNCTITSMRVCGGQAKNAIWNQMKADMTGKVIEVPKVADAELIGNACAGFTGLGIYNTLEEASESLVEIKKAFVPDNKKFSYYQGIFNQYIESYGLFRQAFKTALHDIQSAVDAS